MAVGQRPGAHGGLGGAWPTLGNKKKPEGPKRPVCRVDSRKYDAEDAARARRSKWSMGLCLVALAVGAAYAVWDHAYGPDSNYLEARRLVDQYELGKPMNLRDYRNPVYVDALSKLARVSPDSSSAGEAHALSVRIERDSAEFERLLLERLHARRQRHEAQRVRADRVVAARHRDRVNPVKSYPECDD